MLKELQEKKIEGGNAAKESDRSSTRVINSDPKDEKAPQIRNTDLLDKQIKKPAYRNGPDTSKYKNASSSGSSKYMNSSRRRNTEEVSEKVKEMVNQEEFNISDKQMDLEVPVVKFQETEYPVIKNDMNSTRFIQPTDYMSGKMYKYFEIRNLVNLLTTKEDLESYTREELTLIKNQMAPMAFLEQREGPKKIKLWYYQVHVLENIARAFVQRYSTSDSKLVTLNVNTTWLIGTQLTISLQYKNGQCEQFTDVGSSSFRDVMVGEKNIKSASSDAFKRAFRHFGNLFGMALYDKDYIKWLNTMLPFNCQTQIWNFRGIRHAILLNVYMMLLRTPAAIEAAFNNVKQKNKDLDTNDMLNNTSIEGLAGKILGILDTGMIPGNELSAEEIKAIRDQIESRRTGDAEKKVIE